MPQPANKPGPDTTGVAGGGGGGGGTSGMSGGAVAGVVAACLLAAALLAAGVALAMRMQRNRRVLEELGNHRRTSTTTINAVLARASTDQALVDADGHAEVRGGGSGGVVLARASSTPSAHVDTSGYAAAHGGATALNSFPTEVSASGDAPGHDGCVVLAVCVPARVASQSLWFTHLELLVRTPALDQHQARFILPTFASRVRTRVRWSTKDAHVLAWWTTHAHTHAHAHTHTHTHAHTAAAAPVNAPC